MSQTCKKYLLGNSIPHHQQLRQQSNMSGLQKQQQQPMHTMHQQGGKLQQQQNAQVSPNMLQIQGQHAQSQPAQQLMSQHPSQTTQMHQQLGLQQQPKSLQRDKQQRIQTSGGSTLNHRSLLDQKRVFHSQTPPPEASSTSIDAAMTGNATATGTAIDMQEEVYQRIKSMKKKYLPDLSDMHRKLSQILQQYDSLPQPPKSEGIELLKIFKIVVDRMMGFLNLPKSNVIPKVKLDSYEKQILNILTLHPPRKPGPLQQQIQPTGAHPLSIQQQQRQQQHQLPSSTSIDAVITGNATATGSLVGVQEEVYQTIKSMREKYLPDLSDMHRKISQICQQIVVDKVIGFLNLPKSNVMPSMKDKLDSYEKKILGILTLNRPRKPGPPQQQIQPTDGHPLSIQQQQRQQQHQMPSSTSIDAEVTRNATATGNPIDVQEEVYQTIKSMREKYLPDLSDMHQKISQKCQQYDSLPQPPKSEQIERLKIFKNLLDQMMGFLNLPKSSVMPSLKDKLASYEKHILDILNSNRPRELAD
ncbi:hypothetical protein C5167_021334 [Papaver somniferum]|uniref:Mediator complex subunit 15 KIX domain-containing protein n=1 Tax=Papaver somniferum TaxID=3469 RepID=A0A4Y7IZQ4_PAPSO|nr:hypothetical protein C5167_021334 [Papaver somniferum]